MLHINKIKTMYGLKWAIVGQSYTFDKKGNKTPYNHAVEYINSAKEPRVAIFPYTEEGFIKAKEIRKILMK